MVNSMHMIKSQSMSTKGHNSLLLSQEISHSYFMETDDFITLRQQLG